MPHLAVAGQHGAVVRVARVPLVRLPVDEYLFYIILCFTLHKIRSRAPIDLLNTHNDRSPHAGDAGPRHLRTVDVEVEAVLALTNQR